MLRMSVASAIEVRGPLSYFFMSPHEDSWWPQSLFNGTRGKLSSRCYETDALASERQHPSSNQGLACGTSGVWRGMDLI